MRLISKNHCGYFIIFSGSTIVLLLILNSTLNYRAPLIIVASIAILSLFCMVLQFEKGRLMQKLKAAEQSSRESIQFIEKNYLTHIKFAHDLGKAIVDIKKVADKIKYEDPKLHYLLEQSLQKINAICVELLNTHDQLNSTEENDAFDLENNISQIVNEKRHEFKNVKHLFIYYRMTAPMLHKIRISKTDFYHIFSSIVNNSIEAMEENIEKRLMIVIDPRDQNVDILISDNGKGISEKQQDSVFLENVSNRTDGTGLGLSSCRKTAQKWHGDLTIRKSGPDGTTFLLTLPYTSSSRSTL